MATDLYPCSWFDGKAKAAAEFYCAIFKNSRITTDTPMVVTFELDGKKIMGLNGGPMFQIGKLLGHPEKGQKAMMAMMGMKKMDIAILGNP